MKETVEEIIKNAKTFSTSPAEKEAAKELQDWLLGKDGDLDAICRYVVWAHEENEWARLMRK